MLNSVLLEGVVSNNLSKTVTKNGNIVINFRLNANKNSFEIEMWNLVALSNEKKIRIGNTVRLVGYLKSYKWIDSTGKKRSRVKIVAEGVEKAVFV